MVHQYKNLGRIALIILIGGGACFINWAAAAPVMAAERIRSVKLRIAMDGFDDEGVPILDITSLNKKYDIYDFILSEQPDLLKPCSAEIELNSEDGYHFGPLEQSDIILRGLGGICTKAVKKEEGSTLLLTVELEGLDERTGEVERMELLPSGSAIWNKAPNAYTYQILLYKNSKRTGSTHTTGKEIFDFAPLMEEGGDYYFKIYPLALSGKRGLPSESMSCHVDEKIAEINKSDSQHAEKNREESDELRDEAQEFQYVYSDGISPQNNWVMRGQDWYFFDGSGHAVKDSWQLWKRKWYYLGSEGKMEDRDGTEDKGVMSTALGD